MYNSIQISRGFAALLVVLFHLGGTVALDRYFGAKYFDGPFSFGDAGVSFFFVLSGFVITIAHRKDFGQAHRFGTYIRKRAARIYPTYLVVALAVFAGASLIPALRAGMPQSVPALLAELLLLPQDSGVVGGTGASILLVAWSLQYEVFFYALTGLLILSPRVWIAAVIFLATAFVTVRLNNAAPFPLSFLTTASVPLFGLGMLTAVASKSPTRIDNPGTLAIVGILTFAALGAYEVIIDKLPFRETLYGLASCVIVFGLVRAEEASSRRWSFPKLELLGAASYSLYLVHFPLISVVCKAVRGAGLTGASGAVAAVALSLAVCLVAALALHLWIEKPLLRALSGTSGQGGQPAAPVMPR